MSEKTESLFEMSVSVRADIRAEATTIWARLTDARGVPSWNSTVESIGGEIALGQKLTLRVPAAPGRVFTPRVVVFDVDKKMVWRDGFMPMFRGTRTYLLTPKGSGITEFHMVEVFEGLMLPMIKGSLPDFRPIFDQYAKDLKRVCEAS